MAWFRRYRRRRSSKLSKRRIFGNKSAKAQARQIYSLKRYANKIYRMCKPDVEVFQPSALILTNAGYTHKSVSRIWSPLNGIFYRWDVPNEWIETSSWPTPVNSASDSTFLGITPKDDAIRLKSIQIYGSFSLASPDSDAYAPAYCRIVVCRTREAIPYDSNLDNVNGHYTYPESEYRSNAFGLTPVREILRTEEGWFSAIRGPYQNDVSSKCEILASRVYRASPISMGVSQIPFKFNIPCNGDLIRYPVLPNQILSEYEDEGQTHVIKDNLPSGDLSTRQCRYPKHFYFLAVYIWDPTASSSQAGVLNIQAKVAYTDA